MHPELRQTLDDLGISDACTYHEFEGRDEWLQGRRPGMGASESAALFGVAPDAWSSPRSVYEEKVHDVRPVRAIEALDWGLRLEPVIAQGYADMHEVQLLRLGRFTIIRNRQHPLIQATPDGIVLPPEEGDDRGPGTCQIKNSSAFARDAFNNGLPDHIWVQVQHEMLAMELGWAVVPVLIGGNHLEVFETEADPVFQATIVEAVERFWSDHILPQIPPAVDGSQATTDALKARWGWHTPDSCIVLPEEFEALWHRRQEIQESATQYKEALEEINNRFRDAIRDSHKAIIPGVGVVSYPLVSKQAHAVKATSYRQFFFPQKADPDKAAKLIAAIAKGGA